jgi:PIN domain nuclease of toxin-antitoxin system
LKLLLDTHALLWWWLDSSRLPAPAIQAISEADETFVSAVSAMEITTKHRLGKLALPAAVIGDLAGAVEGEGFLTLALSFRQARLAGSLTMPHGDPFDRLLIAQAITENLTLVSNERLFDQTGVSRLW